MRAYVLEVLRTGLRVALVSGLVGYGLACLVGPYADGQAALVRGNTDVPSERMKVRIPLILGGLSFAIVAATEGVSALVRANKPTPAVTPTPKPPAVTASGMDAEVEALLNQILAQTQAENLTQTPPPSDGESSGTGAPRNLSTTH